MLAGRIVDKVNVVRFNVIFLLITAAGGLFLVKAPSPFIFMLVFLICSVSISCTFVGLPKERIGYIRKEQKGLELALLSVCGSRGDSLGSNVLDVYKRQQMIISPMRPGGSMMKRGILWKVSAPPATLRRLS